MEMGLFFTFSSFEILPRVSLADQLRHYSLVVWIRTPEACEEFCAPPSHTPVDLTLKLRQFLRGSRLQTKVSVKIVIFSGVMLRSPADG